MDKKSILIFGVGPLQKSLIEHCKDKGLFTIGIDPSMRATCKDLVDVFEIVDGQDFEKTLTVARKYNVSGVITAATDKPLVMMALVAKEMNLPFYSVETAEMSTDKYLMKQAFLKGNIPCAKGKLIRSVKEINDFNFPIILKPRDNSGSRGVIFCNSIIEVETAFLEVEQFTKMDTILVEEYIEGKEYSIESLHFEGTTRVIQYTEKITSSLPYNVELGHNQPANISNKDKNQIQLVISKIAETLGFINCASHTELKINNKGIFVIETSPRLGGDFITSHLVPLSTGINMEQALLTIATGDKPFLNKALNRSAIIRYLNFPSGKITHLNLIDYSSENLKSEHFSFNLEIGDSIPEIKNSLNRYGEIIFSGNTIYEAINKFDDFEIDIKTRIEIEKN